MTDYDLYQQLVDELTAKYQYLYAMSPLDAEAAAVADADMLVRNMTEPK